MTRAEAIRVLECQIDRLADAIGELDGEPISDELHEIAAAVAHSVSALKADER